MEALRGWVSSVHCPRQFIVSCAHVGPSLVLPSSVLRQLCPHQSLVSSALVSSPSVVPISVTCQSSPRQLFVSYAQPFISCAYVSCVHVSCLSINRTTTRQDGTQDWSGGTGEALGNVSLVKEGRENELPVEKLVLLNYPCHFATPLLWYSSIPILLYFDTLPFRHSSPRSYSSCLYGPYYYSLDTLIWSHPRRADALLFGCTIPIVVQGNLMCTILDKLIPGCIAPSSLKHISLEKLRHGPLEEISSCRVSDA